MIRAICVYNDVNLIPDAAIRGLVSRTVHIVGEIAGLVVGKSYTVSAVEAGVDGVSIYVMGVAGHWFPTPYPAALFRLAECTLPLGWEISFSVTPTFEGSRVSFAEWARDDAFYEKLVDGDPGACDVYERFISSTV